MRRENNSVLSSTKNEAVVNHVKAQKTERTPLLTNDKYFDQPLPQLAIDWESSSAHSCFFLERTLDRRRDTVIHGGLADLRPTVCVFSSSAGIYCLGRSEERRVGTSAHLVW